MKRKITIRASRQRAAPRLPLWVREAEKVHWASSLAGASTSLGSWTIGSGTDGQGSRATTPTNTIVIRWTVALPSTNAGLDTLRPIWAARNWATTLSTLGIDITVGVGTAFARLGTRAAGWLA